MLLFSVHPKPKGRKVDKMNFVTLKELKKMVPVAEEGKRPPSLTRMMEEGTEVVLRKLMENHAEVVVYTAALSSTARMQSAFRNCLAANC